MRPPVPEAAEHALDQVALTIGVLVEGMALLRVGLLGMTGSVPRSTRKRRNPSLSYAASPAKLRPGGTALINAVATRASVPGSALVSAMPSSSLTCQTLKAARSRAGRAAQLGRAGLPRL